MFSLHQAISLSRHAVAQLRPRRSVDAHTLHNRMALPLFSPVVNVTQTLSTLRRGLAGPLSSRMRLPMRGLDEFREPEPLKADTKLVVGRSWTVPELRQKSFEDLHRLWFVLYKEKNMIMTEALHCTRTQQRMPQADRRQKVKRSMKAVRVVVGERQRIKRTLLKERQMDERRLNRETLEVDTSSSEARYD